MTQKEFDKNIFKKMTNEEQMELAVRGLFGQWIYGENGDVTIYMSSYGLKNYNDYKNEMILKYENTNPPSLPIIF